MVGVLRMTRVQQPDRDRHQESEVCNVRTVHQRM